MALPDCSDYYDQEQNALDEHLSWILDRSWQKKLDFVSRNFDREKLTSAVEFGCASAIMAHAWKNRSPRLDYLGIDKSKKMLELAMSEKLYPANGVGELRFDHGDVRLGGKPRDCVLAFSLLKHISLDEWDDVFCTLLSCGRFAAFDVQLFSEDLDNGEKFPHVFVCEDRFQRALAAANHEIIVREDQGEHDLPGRGRMRHVFLWTRAMS